MAAGPIQYDYRRDGAGWTIFDRWTGQVVVLEGHSQCGLLLVEAQDIADRLNSRRSLGERDILQ